MQLRPYQREAVLAVYHHLRTRENNPVVVIPTGGGKTPVLATICRDAVELWNGRVLVVSHVKELLAQAADKLRLVAPDLPVGIYSAGLNRRDTDHRVIIAGIQSVYRRAAELESFDLVIVDEAHTIPSDGDGMYRQFLAEARIVNPQLRVIGLTATPYRLDCGPICTPNGVLHHVCYEIGVRQLIHEGYLCRLVSKAGATKVDTSGLHVRGGEFVAEEVETLMDQEEIVKAACRETVECTVDRRSCLIFAAGIRHGQHIARILREDHHVECGFVCGETPAGERDDLLARFRGDRGRPPLKYLVNVNVLATGFDAPNIDCIVLLRPTNSPGLFYQQVGRGFRVHPSKKDCLVLDFAGNILRHGPVDQIEIRTRPGTTGGAAPAKECPECRSVIAAGFACCPDCDYAFPPPETRHDSRASEAAILSGEVTVKTCLVEDISYSVHTKRGASEAAPKSMRVDYRVGFRQWHSEWICFEHTGYAAQKAAAWWLKRSPDPVPDTAERAVEMANSGALAPTNSITVRSVSGEPFDRIIDYELGPMPEPAESADPFADMDIPF